MLQDPKSSSTQRKIKSYFGFQDKSQRKYEFQNIKYNYITERYKKEGSPSQNFFEINNIETENIQGDDEKPIANINSSIKKNFITPNFTSEIVRKIISDSKVSNTYMREERNSVSATIRTSE